MAATIAQIPCGQLGQRIAVGDAVLPHGRGGGSPDRMCPGLRGGAAAVARAAIPASRCRPAASSPFVVLRQERQRIPWQAAPGGAGPR